MIDEGPFFAGKEEMNMEDRHIVDLYWARSERAITETMSKYGSYCYRIAFNILSNHEDAEESVNDTYLAAWNCMPPHRPSILSSFLGKLTRRLSIDRWRAKRAGRRGGGEIELAVEELSECIPSGNTVEWELENAETAKLINDFIHSLSATERRVFICRYWYLDSISFIGQQFGYSDSKVKSMLYRTRKKLSAYLAEGGVFLDC